MATQIRKCSPEAVDLATAVNDMKSFLMAQLRLAQADVATIAADSDVGVTPTFVALGSHNDKSEVLVTAANASDLATSLTLVNELIGVYTFHMADTLGHKVAGVALASTVPATTLATAITRANDIKSKYETHRASTTYHYTADSTNTISASNASDQSSLNTLLNELKTDINAHVVSGPAFASIRLVDA
jgi:hypothetical protein